MMIPRDIELDIRDEVLLNRRQVSSTTCQFLSMLGSPPSQCDKLPPKKLAQDLKDEKFNLNLRIGNGKEEKDIRAEFNGQDVMNFVKKVLARDLEGELDIRDIDDLY
jgi:hypothetical protein